MVYFAIVFLASSAVLGLLGSAYFYGPLWLQAYSSKTRIKLSDLMSMSLKRVSPQIVVQSQVKAIYSELALIRPRQMEAHVLAGGDLQRVVQAMIKAHQAGLKLDWETASSIDLAGRNVLEAVNASVNPRTIRCPPAIRDEQDFLSCMSKDGIELRVCVLVTVRTDLLRLVGGANEETMIARVGQAAVSSIGGCTSYREILSDPAIITRRILSGHFDKDSSLSIVSVDVPFIDVGSNIGASLLIQQADADMRVAVATAEVRFAGATAFLQEMCAWRLEKEASVIRAEALIPVALAVSLRIHILEAGTPVMTPHLVLDVRATSARALSSETKRTNAEDLRRRQEVWESEGGACLATAFKPRRHPLESCIDSWSATLGARVSDPAA